MISDKWLSRYGLLITCDAKIPHFEDLHLRMLLTSTVSGNKVRVCYHLCIRHTLDTVFELHQSSENKHRYFLIIKNKNTYRLSYAVQYYCILVICVFLKNFTSLEVFSAKRKNQVQPITVQQSRMSATYDGIGNLIRNNLHKRHQILSEFRFSPNCHFHL